MSTALISDDDPIQQMDSWHCRISFGQRELFRLIAEVDRRELWRDAGAREMAQWLWMRNGLSDWKARRWIAAAHALESLPRIAQAFCSGQLGVDKVVELTRFATPETEAALIAWAERMSPGRIRHRGDVETKRSAHDAADPERARTLSWWYHDDGRRFGLEADLPAAQGALVARALERLADQIPSMPGEEDAFFIDARRADALVALASSQLASDPDPDRATVVVHPGVDAPPAEVSGPRVPLPGVRGEEVHPGPPRHLVGERRQNRPGQPGPDLLLPSSAGPRVRVDDPTDHRRRRGGLVPSRWDQVSCRAGAATSKT